MKEVRIAIAGVGNCASSLLQGLEYYRRRDAGEGAGLLRHEVGGYGVGDVRPVAAFDVDRRKVGRPLQEAVFAPPNCATVFQRELPDYGVTVAMGPVLDGVAAHMQEHPEERAFRVSDERPVDVVSALRETRADVLVVYLPVGSDDAVKTYAEACLAAGVALVNCVPVFVASDPELSARFRERGVPVVGDDVKSQFGATLLHRLIARALCDRGVELERTYQLNTGGNTDFLNMLEQARLRSKRISKTESVQSQLDVPLAPERIHIGPSDYVAWQGDNKVCFLRLEWRGFGGVPMNLEARLSVDDSPNSAGVVIDAVRCAKVGLDRGLGGPLEEVSAVTMKRPPRQMRDDEARVALERFLASTPPERRREGAAASGAAESADRVAAAEPPAALGARSSSEVAARASTGR